MKCKNDTNWQTWRLCAKFIFPFPSLDSISDLCGVVNSFGQIYGDILRFSEICHDRWEVSRPAPEYSFALFYE